MKWAPELAEGIGAFVLVLAGCGAIVSEALTGQVGHVGIALSFGLAIGGMVYAVGHVSGAHFNPAVTLAFAANGHFPWRRAPGYILAQTAGAGLAAACLMWFLPDVGTLGGTAPHVSVGAGQAFTLEILLTAVLMFVIAAVATDGRAVGAMAGSAIGGTVALSALWAGPLTGASMNPARSLGPALFGDATGSLWIYIMAPLLGALFGARLYEWTRLGKRPVHARPEAPLEFLERRAEEDE